MSDLSGLITNKTAIELACRLPENTQEKVIALATEAAINDVQFDDENRVQRYSESLKLNMEQVLDLIGLYISIIRVFMESDAKQFRETMSAVGFNEEFIEKFPLKHKHNPVSLILNANEGGIQKLTSFMWRVDISFTSGVLNVRVPPKIIVSLLLNNGQKYIFEIDLNTFNRLRFNVALAFKEFNILKHSNTLKNKIIL